MEISKNWLKARNKFTGRFIFINMNNVDTIDPVFVPDNIETSYISFNMMNGDFFHTPYAPGELYRLLGFTEDETITLNIHDNEVRTDRPGEG